MTPEQASSIRAEKKDEMQDNSKLLVGVWKVTTADKNAPLDIGDTIEFSKDGANKTTPEKAGKEVLSQGIHRFEKDKLVLAVKSEKGVAQKVLRIKKITDTELVLSLDKGGQVIEFQKVLPAVALPPRYAAPRLYGGLPQFSPGLFYHGGYPAGR